MRNKHFIIKTVYFFYLILVSILSHAQCPGFNNVENLGAQTNVTVTGSTFWDFPFPSVQSSDNSYAIMRLGTSIAVTTHYLITYNWGFSFTTGTICGIKVRVEKAAPVTNLGTVTDLEAKLWNGSAYSPNNYADVVTPWPGTDTYFTYGGNSDLWGWGSITAAQANAVAFGFRFRAQRSDVTDTVKIDHIEMTAHSDEFLPVDLLYFDAIKNITSKSVQFKWTCASEYNNDFFTIERSKDNLSWEIVRKVQGAGNSTLPTNYETTDTEPYPGQSYYRLSQTDYDGTTKILDMMSVRFKNYLDDIVLYPSLAYDFVEIKSKGNINNSTIIITDIFGRELKQVIVNEDDTAHEFIIDISSFSPGVYLLKLYSGDFQACQKFIKH